MSRKLDEQREAFREGRAQIRIEDSEFDFAEYSRFLVDNAEDISAFQQRQQQAFNHEVTRWQEEEGEAEAQLLPPQIDEEEVDGYLVSADLNGSVWKILVEPGQQVEAGQPLIVVEAMKMELAVTAPRAGIIKRISCQQGRPVGPGDALLWLEHAS